MSSVATCMSKLFQLVTEQSLFCSPRWWSLMFTPDKESTGMWVQTLQGSNLTSEFWL